MICQLNPLRKFQPPRYFTRRKRIRPLIHEVLPQFYTPPSYIKRLYIYIYITPVIPNNYQLLPYRPIFHPNLPGFSFFLPKTGDFGSPGNRWISERWFKSEENRVLGWPPRGAVAGVDRLENGPSKGRLDGCETLTYVYYHGMKIDFNLGILGDNLPIKYSLYRAY